jgi:hypothetical protein
MTFLGVWFVLSVSLCAVKCAAAGADAAHVFSVGNGFEVLPIYTTRQIAFMIEFKTDQTRQNFSDFAFFWIKDRKRQFVSASLVHAAPVYLPVTLFVPLAKPNPATAVWLRDGMFVNDLSRSFVIPAGFVLPFPIAAAFERAEPTLNVAGLDVKRNTALFAGQKSAVSSCPLPADGSRPAGAGSDFFGSGHYLLSRGLILGRRFCGLLFGSVPMEFGGSSAGHTLEKGKSFFKGGFAYRQFPYLRVQCRNFFFDWGYSLRFPFDFHGRIVRLSARTRNIPAAVSVLSTGIGKSLSAHFGTGNLAQQANGGLSQKVYA